MQRPNSTAPLDFERPWLGLLSYEAQHEQLFFGREEEVAKLLARVNDRPLTVLYGRSGLGKSSLLRAGLLPRLVEAGYLPIPVRLAYAESSPDPQTQLRDALVAAIGQSFPDEADLFLLLHDPVYGICGELPRHKPPVFLLDQFEEIFTLGQKRPETAGRLLEALGILAENFRSRALASQFEADPSLRARLDRRAHVSRVVLSLRDDFVYALDRWKRELPSLPDNRFELLPLDGPKAFRAVRLPGLLRDPERPIVTEQCAEDIVRFVAGPPPNRPLEEISAVPPLLSLICSELNKRRLEKQVDQIEPTFDKGTAREILEAFYQRAFEKRPGALRELVEQRMVSSVGTRQPINWDEAVVRLTSQTFPETDAKQLLATLVDERLFIVVDAGGLPRIELTHDILCEVAVASRARAEELAAAQRAAAEKEAEERRRGIADENEKKARQELREKQRLLDEVRKLKKVSDEARKNAELLARERADALERESYLLHKTRRAYADARSANRQKFLLVGLLLGLTGLGMGLWRSMQHESDKQRLLAAFQAERAKALAQEKERLRVSTNELQAALSEVGQNRATRALLDDDPGAAAVYLLRAIEYAPKNESALAQLWFLLRYAQMGSGWALENQVPTESRAEDIELHPTEAVLALRDKDDVITLRDLKTGAILRDLGKGTDSDIGEGSEAEFAFVAGGQRLLISNTLKWRLYDPFGPPTGEPVTIAAPDQDDLDLRCFNKARHYYLGLHAKGAKPLVRMMDGHTIASLDLILPFPYWRTDGSAFFAFTSTGQVQLRAGETGEPLGEPFGPKHTAPSDSALRIYPDATGQFAVLSGGAKRATSLWKLDPTPKELWSATPGSIARIDWDSATGAVVVRLGSSVQYLDPRTAKPVLTPNPPKRPDDGGPSSSSPRSLSRRGTVSIVNDWRSGEKLRCSSKSPRSGPVELSATGERVVDGRVENFLLLWSLPGSRSTRWDEIPSKARLDKLRGATREFVSPNKEWRITLPASGAPRVSRLQQNIEQSGFDLALQRVADVDWSTDGGFLSVAYEDGRIQRFAWNPPRRWEPVLVAWIRALAGERITKTDAIEPTALAEQLVWRERLNETNLEDPGWLELKQWWQDGRPPTGDRPEYVPIWVREPDPPPSVDPAKSGAGPSEPTPAPSKEGPPIPAKTTPKPSPIRSPRR